MKLLPFTVNEYGPKGSAAGFKVLMTGVGNESTTVTVAWPDTAEFVALVAVTVAVDAAAGAVKQALEVGVADEAGQVDDVGQSFDVDLGLQFGEVCSASGNHAADIGDAMAQMADRPREDLEALLVLDSSPRNDQRLSPTLRRRCRR